MGVNKPLPAPSSLMNTNYLLNFRVSFNKRFIRKYPYPPPLPCRRGCHSTTIFCNSIVGQVDLMLFTTATQRGKTLERLDRLCSD